MSCRLSSLLTCHVSIQHLALARSLEAARPTQPRSRGHGTARQVTWRSTYVALPAGVDSHSLRTRLFAPEFHKRERRRAAASSKYEKRLASTPPALRKRRSLAPQNTARLSSDVNTRDRRVVTDHCHVPGGEAADARGQERP